MTQILLKNIDMEGLTSLEVYEKQGGYKTLAKAFAKKPDEVLEMVKASGLRGRGRVSHRVEMVIPGQGRFSPLSGLQRRRERTGDM